MLAGNYGNSKPTQNESGQVALYLAGLTATNLDPINTTLPWHPS
jgi:hypothetical protein